MCFFQRLYSGSLGMRQGRVFGFELDGVFGSRGIRLLWFYQCRLLKGLVLFEVWVLCGGVYMCVYMCVYMKVLCMYSVYVCVQFYGCVYVFFVCMSVLCGCVFMKLCLCICSCLCVCFFCVRMNMYVCVRERGCVYMSVYSCLYVLCVYVFMSGVCL